MIGKIYKLEGGDKFYIGSTMSELNERLKKHKSKSNENISKTRKVYCYFKEIGWNNVKIFLIKEVNISNRKDLLEYEKEEIVKYINNINCLNSILPITTIYEKKVKNAIYNRKRREDNPEKERHRLQTWRKNNPDKRRQQIIRERNKKESNSNLK